MVRILSGRMGSLMARPIQWLRLCLRISISSLCATLTGKPASITNGPCECIFLFLDSVWLLGNWRKRKSKSKRMFRSFLTVFFFSFYCFSFLCSWKRLTWLCYCKLRRILLLIVSLNFLRNQAVAFLFFYFMDFDFIARCLLLAFVLFHKIVCIDCLL